MVYSLIQYVPEKKWTQAFEWKKLENYLYTMEYIFHGIYNYSSTILWKFHPIWSCGSKEIRIFSNTCQRTLPPCFWLYTWIALISKCALSYWWSIIIFIHFHKTWTQAGTVWEMKRNNNHQANKDVKETKRGYFRWFILWKLRCISLPCLYKSCHNCKSWMER